MHCFVLLHSDLIIYSYCRWGQVFILDALSTYKAADALEAENIVERVTPRLQHANCAVVLSAVKVALFNVFSFGSIYPPNLRKPN